jgi:hypothetical protein
MLGAATLLFFPIAVAAFMLHIRRKYSLASYTAWSAPFLVLAVVVWLSTSSVVLSYVGPLNASGFESWAASAAVAVLVGICAIPLRSLALRWVQGVAAFISFNFVVLLGSWIA